MPATIDQATPTAAVPTARDLLNQFESVRGTSTALAEPLEPEDCVIQSMPDASPTKWHLAHTSWFFETFLLAPRREGYEPASADANYLFNSYYNAIGERISRSHRGLLSRPTMLEVARYRHEVDSRVGDLLSGLDEQECRDIAPIVILGLNHEQQHQELLLTDIKHAFGSNPIRPAYRTATFPRSADPGPVGWITGASGIRAIGFAGEGFSFDNEHPRHDVLLSPHEIGSRLVTVGEYLEFIDSGGYERPEFWLSDGWAARNAGGWQAPLYWEKIDGHWWSYTLAGRKPVDLFEPVVHISFYEADAFARWSGYRLPTEPEWETAATNQTVAGQFLDSGRLHPGSADKSGTEPISQLFGDVWEWTATPYTAYPGFRAAEGALGEYNGKFMCNQMILRGGSCVSPRSHLRASYRNFFPPQARWQFTGIRLAR